MDQRELLDEMDTFARQILGLKPGDSTDSADDCSTSRGESTDDVATGPFLRDGDAPNGRTERPPRLKYVRYHRAARAASGAIPSKEVLFVGDLGNRVSNSSSKDRRAKAYDTLIRNSIR